MEDARSGKVKTAPETGRISSSYSIVFHCGGNEQNIPRRFDIDFTRLGEDGSVVIKTKESFARTIYLPEDGHVLFEADLSQAEARVVAYLAGEARLMSIFESGGDIHRLNASWVFGRQLSEVTKDQRTFAKTHVHALNYGEGPNMLAERAGMSVRMARNVVDKYFQMFPAIRMWHMELQHTLQRGFPRLGWPKRTLYNLLGRRRTFFGRMDESTFRESYAYVPQSTIGDLLNIQYCRNWEQVKLEKLRALPYKQVHDSMIWSVHPEDVKRLAEIISKNADFELEWLGRKFKIPIEFKAGPTWGDLKDWTPDASR